MARKIFQLMVSCVLALCCCNAAAAQDSIRIVTTTSLVADLVKNVAGAKFEGKEVAVTPLMGAGVDPHLYKATQGDLRQLLASEITFYSGLHLEGKMSDALENLAKQRKVFPISSSIPEKFLRFPKDFQGHADPHVWFDVKLWTYTIDTVEKVLKENYPSAAAQFGINAASYRAKLDELDSWTKQEIAKIPPAQRVLITAHDAFGYFGQAYNIEVMGLQGISTAGEFGLSDVSRLVDVIINRKIKAIFVESSVPQKYVLALQEGVRAKGSNVEIGGQLYSDSLGEPDSAQGDYIGMIKYNVETIVKALQ